MLKFLDLSVFEKIALIIKDMVGKFNHYFDRQHAINIFKIDKINTHSLSESRKYLLCKIPKDSNMKLKIDGIVETSYCSFALDVVCNLKTAKTYICNALGGTIFYNSTMNVDTAKGRETTRQISSWMSGKVFVYSLPTSRELADTNLSVPLFGTLCTNVSFFKLKDDDNNNTITTKSNYDSSSLKQYPPFDLVYGYDDTYDYIFVEIKPSNYDNYVSCDLHLTLLGNEDIEQSYTNTGNKSMIYNCIHDSTTVPVLSQFTESSISRYNQLTLREKPLNTSTDISASRYYGGIFTNPDVLIYDYHLLGIDYNITKSKFPIFWSFIPTNEIVFQNTADPDYGIMLCRWVYSKVI